MAFGNHKGKPVIGGELGIGAYDIPGPQHAGAGHVNDLKPAIGQRAFLFGCELEKFVRRLYRTSLPIPHAGGTYPPKALPHIMGGLLTVESDWKPPLGQSLLEALDKGLGERRLDIGCVAAHGMFACDAQGCHGVSPHAKAATAFLLELIARLQSSATAPMIDVRAYAKWLAAELAHSCPRALGVHGARVDLIDADPA